MAIQQRLWNGMPGIRRAVPRAAWILAATTYTLFQISPGRTARITKLIFTDTSGLAGLFTIGRGDFTAIFPPLTIFANLETILTEDELPGFEFRNVGSNSEDITFQTTTSTAGSAMIEIEEYGPGQ